MSSGNGYIVRKHPKGGFCAVDYSKSIQKDNGYDTPDGYPYPTGKEEQFATIQATLDVYDSAYILDSYYSEYGAHMDAECENIQRELYNQLHETVNGIHVGQYECTCGWNGINPCLLSKHQADSLREQLRQLQ